MYTHGDESSDRGPVPTAAWEEIRMRLAETVAALVRGIRGGRFPVHSVDEQCTGRCGFATVCRINHVRALEKIWNPVPQNA
jgi:hypothetical protein